MFDFGSIQDIGDVVQGEIEQAATDATEGIQQAATDAAEGAEQTISDLNPFA